MDAAGRPDGRSDPDPALPRGAGQVMAADLSDGMEAATLQGKSVTFTLGDGVAMVNDANIIATDIGRRATASSMSSTASSCRRPTRQWPRKPWPRKLLRQRR